MSPHPIPNQDPPASRGHRVSALPLILAGAGWIAAELSGPAAVYAAAGLSLAALLAALAGSLRRREPRPWGLLLAAAVTAAACLPEMLPLPGPQQALTQAAEKVQRNWDGRLDQLGRVLGDLPPAGSDFRWLEERLATLGEGAGMAVIAADGPLSWAGWTTPLTDLESQALAEGLDPGPGMIVLRRGLNLRLVCARSFSGETDLIAVAEVPLPREPLPGWLARDLGPDLHARLRWQAFGEGIQAEIGEAGSDAGPGLFWSMVPLMNPSGRLMARLTLTQAAASTIRGRQQERRGAIASLAALLWLLGTALARRPAAAARILAARGVWALGRPAMVLGGAGSGVLGPWLPDRWALPPGWVEPWVGTPLAAALTGLALVGAAALVPLPRSPRWRWVIGLLAAAGGLAGLAAVWWVAIGGAVSPGAVLLPAGHLPPRLLLLLALAALPWAALFLAGRALRPGVGPRWWIVSAGMAGLLAGGVHGLSLGPEGRGIVTRELAPEIQSRRTIWEQALRQTRLLAVPLEGGNVLARERAAIDLWWNSPLGRWGLASGVWKYSEEGVLLDRFITGIPPVDPEPRLLGEESGEQQGPFPRRFLEPEPVELQFVEGIFRLVVTEVRRPEGGSWIAAVLDEPANIPSRRRADPLGAFMASSKPRRAIPRLGTLAVRMAWFDQGGRLLFSDLDAGPPAPLAPPTAPVWRRASLEGVGRAELYEMADPVGTVAAIVTPPGKLEMAAIALGWAICLILLALVAVAIERFHRDPGGFIRHGAAALRSVGTSFRVQLAVVLVLSGLIPLLALAGAGRAAALAQARQRLNGEGERTAHFARRLVEDYLALGEAQDFASEQGERVTAWLARTLGEDLFLWQDGQLLAGSRPDLVRAGLWPERLSGRVWRSLSSGRLSMLIERRGALVTGASARAVVHAPYRSPGGQPAVLSIPLAHAGKRFAASVADMDRALLVSTALLLVLAFLVLEPATRRLVRPLAELEKATGRLAAGHFDTAVPETGYEETRTLARAFRTMTRSLAEQRRSLERRRAAIETIIASIPLAVLAVTRGGQVWAANPRASQLLGVRPEQPFTAGESALSRAVADLLDAEGKGQISVESIVGDLARHFHLSALDLPGLIDGQALRLIVIEDLTDAMRSERLAAWAEMARRIAHEIKNPLTPISLMVDHVGRLLERDDPRMPEVLGRCLTTIEEQVTVLKETAREFNDYSRLLNARPESLDLDEALRSWLAPYAMATDRPVRFELVGGEIDRKVAADPRLLRRAVVNLVENALAAAGETGGSVRVGWEVGTSTPVMVRIWVEDKGPGIEPERLAQLFEPDVTTRETGTGLGLPIARQAVEAHGGHIEVDSAPGQGSRFSILIPLEPEPLPGEGEGEMEPPP